MADILVVDDEAAVRWVVTDALRRAGHECREAGDGAAALSAVRERPPDAILCDVRMPRLDGFGFLRQLAAPGRTRPPIVFLTSNDDTQAVEAAKGSGAFDYLLKPCEEALLREVVARAVAQGPTLVPAGAEPPFPEPEPKTAYEEPPPVRPAHVVAVPLPPSAPAEPSRRGWRGALRGIFRASRP